MAENTMDTLTPPKKKINPIALFVLAVFVLLLIFGFGMKMLKDNLTQIDNGAAPDFVIKTYDGKVYKLSDLRGKVVVLNFWASWCGPCRSEAPELNAVWSEYKDKGVVMIGAGYLDNENDAQNYLKEFGIKYSTGPDVGSQISTEYLVKAVPENYVIDKDGNLALTVKGPTTAKDLRTVLDKLIG